MIGSAGCAEDRESTHKPPKNSLHFMDVTRESGLSSFRHINGSEGEYWYPEQMGAGGGFVDYNLDGWEDVVLVGGGRLSTRVPDSVMAIRLFRNNQDGTFTDVTTPVGLASSRAYGTGLAIADYDNDGDQDIFLTTFGENLLFRNDPGVDGGRERVFSEVGRQAGVSGPYGWGSSALFFDADRDGHLDLFKAGYVRWSIETDEKCFRENGNPDYCPPATYPGDVSYFYHNNGDGTFTERTEAVGLRHGAGKSLAVAEWDFDQDRWSDLIVVNDGEPDLLFINNGDGTFTEQGLARGIAYGEHGEARAGMGVDVGVVDSSGYPTLFVGNFSSEMISVYRQTSNGWFSDRAALSGIGRSSLSTLAFGVLLFDAEMDADLDLFVANGHVYLDPIDGSSYRQPPHLFVNQGDGRFLDHAPATGGALGQHMIARSVSKADYDKDGDLDMLVTENNGPVHLFRNDSDRGKVLRVRLGSRNGNADAIGATVTAFIDGFPQVRRVRTGSSYLSSSEKVLSFGLGDAEQVDRLSVVWPSGQSDSLAALPVDIELHIIEGKGVISQMALPHGNPVQRGRHDRTPITERH